MVDVVTPGFAVHNFGGPLVIIHLTGTDGFLLTDFVTFVQCLLPPPHPSNTVASGYRWSTLQDDLGEAIVSHPRDVLRQRNYILEK